LFIQHFDTSHLATSLLHCSTLWVQSAFADNSASLQHQSTHLSNGYVCCY